LITAASAAQRLDLAPRVGGQQHAGLLAETCRGGDPAQVGRTCEQAERARHHEPREQQQRDPRLEQGAERAAIGALKRGCEHACRAEPEQRKHRPGQQRRHEFALVNLHAQAPSSSRTLSASSRVEKGLVM
jgi:hypothetical protein